MVVSFALRDKGSEGGGKKLRGRGVGLGMVPPSYEDANIGGVDGTPHSYSPGNDDTFIPNPGYEVPIGGGNFADP